MLTETAKPVQNAQRKIEKVEQTALPPFPCHTQTHTLTRAAKQKHGDSHLHTLKLVLSVLWTIFRLPPSEALTPAIAQFHFLSFLEQRTALATAEKDRTRRKRWPSRHSAKQKAAPIEISAAESRNTKSLVFHRFLKVRYRVAGVREVRK